MTAIVAPPTITALPPAPQPTDTPATFSAKAFARVAADDTFVTQTNAIGANVYSNAIAADERATAADASKTAATASATAAADSATAAASSATSASTHDGNAAASATSAAGSATAASASYMAAAGSASDAHADAIAVAAALASIADGPVSSVNGHTGVVMLTKADLGLGDVDDVAMRRQANYINTAAAALLVRRANVLQYAGAMAVTMPAAPSDEDELIVILANGRIDNAITITAGIPVMGVADSLVLDTPGPFTLRYFVTPNEWRLV